MTADKTDDELRKLAETVVADSGFVAMANGLCIDTGTREATLAFGVLRLLNTLKAWRGLNVSDVGLLRLRERYATIQEEIELYDKRWGAAVDDMLSDIDQLRQQRDVAVVDPVSVQELKQERDLWKERAETFLDQECIEPAVWKAQHAVIENAKIWYNGDIPNGALAGVISDLIKLETTE